MSRIPLTYYTNIKFYTQYTHPTLICRGTDERTDGRTENIYSIFRDKLLLLGEHVLDQDASKICTIILPWGHYIPQELTMEIADSPDKQIVGANGIPRGCMSSP